MRGYFGIGIYQTKTRVNVGTLLRSAYQLGAEFVFTVGRRYHRQSSDTLKTWRHIPLYHYETADELKIPYDCLLVGIEMGGDSLVSAKHPQRAVYILGAEDNGLPKEIISRCHRIISIPSVRTNSYNVAVAGSIVMYDRIAKKLEVTNE